jgi:hypothetical protein
MRKRMRRGKLAKAMGEMKRGTLRSGSKRGPKVTSRRQALAIGLDSARRAGERVPKEKRTRKRQHARS